MGAVAAGAGVIGGIIQSVSSAKDVKRGRDALNNYVRQSFKNVYEGQKISTLGSNLQIDQLQQATATTIGALRAGGARTLLGGIGKVQQQNVQAARQIGADLDQQQIALDRLEASDEIRIQQMQEQRERDDIAGLGQQIQAGRQGVMSGLSNIAGAVGAGAQMQMMQNYPTGVTNPFVSKVPTTTQSIATASTGLPAATTTAPIFGGAVGFNAPIFTG